MPSIEKTPPAAALAELKAYLRIEDSGEDALLSQLLRAATETVEAMLGLLLFEREVEERGEVRDGALRLVAEPARSLVSAEAVAADGTGRVLAAGEGQFRVGRYGEGRLDVPAFPDCQQLVVRYRAGMASDWNWVPEVLRLSVIRAAAHFHAHRDAPDEPGVPPAVRRMLTPWRARRIR
ncbi:hypothetical protein FJQ54_15730 [Sandaracinobacter neustonicus]|uniref:Phage gp6-like head-tail connector protein n=1 Tax=Sandaracinobacter neustonicus TaxID=1715348 RepID=A0A501XD52_9SPHN|nr:head-tail connector protein [Sandaracinobacter neustonicus]TPE58515.1 hypothetical protein FJQ54_15730 [Sandaracinobacter neustonicus]